MKLSYSIILLTCLLALSCAGSRGSAIQPDTSNPLSTSSTPDSAIPNGSQLWGFWDVEWNNDTGNFDAIPLRSADFACNVIKFINKSPMNLTIKVNSIVHDAGFVNFDVDISLRHPFPGLNVYTGFDVMGVLMGDGSVQYPGPEGFTVAGPNDQQLLNADGYTRRFNAPEFADAGKILPLQGYFPGNKGSAAYVPTAILNPYKYYADGFDATSDAFGFLKDYSANRGCFRPGSSNTRNYKLRMSSGHLKFQYAVLANWEPNENHPQPPATLDDFPVSANSQEAVAISVADFSDAYFVNTTTYGGDIAVDITPWDWSASTSTTMDEYSIKLYSTAWTGPFLVNMTPTSSSEHRYTFHAEVPATTLSASGPLPVWVEVDYPAFDYTSPVGIPNKATGPLASYFLTQVNILDHNPGVAGSFIYGFGDSDFMEDCNSADDSKLFINLLNLPLTGPYAQNKKVLYYEGHTSGFREFPNFDALINSLGYESVYVPAVPYVPLDTTGVKMLILMTFYSVADELFTPEEIQNIKDLMNGGGIVIILIDGNFWYVMYGGTTTLEQLLSELNVEFSCPTDGVYNSDYTDITPDPITAGVSLIEGANSGRFEVFGDGVSLVRGTADIEYTTICKSPWKG